MSGSIVKPTFKVQSIAGGDEKSLTLYNDLTKILKLDNSTKFLKEIKKYSVALKDHYEDVTKKKYTIKITEENLNCEETKKYELN